MVCPEKPMSTTDPTTASAPRAVRRPAAGRARRLARAALWRLAPGYARRRSRRIAAAASVARLEDEVVQLRKRQSEQIERLEDLVRELILSVEALRRAGTRDELQDES
jgi:hypothetical protein